MIILGLGTNLGDRARQLEQAVASLRAILSNLVCSHVYESSALLPEAAPPEWDKPFLNMAVAGNCDLSPRDLLNHLQNIERELGRGVHEHWSPRPIDIDILAWDDKIINEPDLAIPHTALTERDFALVPFCDLAPEWVYPGMGPHHGKTIRAIAQQVRDALTRVDMEIK